MPLYSFTEIGPDGQIDPYGNTITQSYSMKDEIPREIIVEGIHYLRDVWADHASRMAVAAKYPIYSQALGCQPWNAEKFQKASVDMGVPTEFCVVDASGIAKPKFESQAHQNAYLKKIGWLNRDRYA